MMTYPVVALGSRRSGPRLGGVLLLTSTVAIAACSGEHNPTAPSAAGAPPLTESIGVSELGTGTSSTLAVAQTTICHRTMGTNDFVVTKIPESSLQSHMDHGDMRYSPISLAAATYTASKEAASAIFAFDGNPATSWSSAGFPVQYIEVNFGSPQAFWKIASVVSQHPSGNTVHQVTLDGVPAFNWTEVTTYGDLLSHKFNTVQTAQRVRITTTQSPSWVAWLDISFPQCA
jgi:hypothetical protein